MKKIKALKILLLTILLVICSISPAFADPDDEIMAGDEYDVVYATKRSEENTCRLSFTVAVPEGFTNDAAVDVLNMDNDTVYRLIAYHENGYTAGMYVPAGDYLVIRAYIYDDNTAQYPLTEIPGFTLTDGENHTMEAKLQNYEEIEQELQERIEQITENAQNTENAENPEATGSAGTINQFQFPKDEELPWRQIEKDGSGTGSMTISGLSADVYELIVRIAESGELKEAEFVYSLDGGLTWSSNQMVLPSVELRDYRNGKKTGLKLVFDGAGIENISAFEKNDTYTIKLAHEYQTESTSVGQAKILFTSQGVVEEDARIVLTIIKTGTLGDAIFTATRNGTEYAETVISEDGFYMLTDAIRVEFAPMGSKFFVNDTFSADIPHTKVTEETGYILYGLAGFLVLLIFAGYVYLASKKEKDSAYQINPYIPVDRELLHRSRIKKAKASTINSGKSVKNPAASSNHQSSITPEGREKKQRRKHDGD